MFVTELYSLLTSGENLPIQHERTLGKRAAMEWAKIAHAILNAMRTYQEQSECTNGTVPAAPSAVFLGDDCLLQVVLQQILQKYSV